MELTEGQKRYRKYRETYIKYARKNRKKNYDYNDKYRFGGLRDKVLQRDNYCCQKCGLTNKEHIRKWNREITIDHINGKGRNSKNSDNTMENLITLCLSCHGKKDIVKSPVSHPKPILQIDKRGNVVNMFPSSMEAKRTMLFNDSHINECLHGHRKTHGGFRWLYAKL